MSAGNLAQNIVVSNNKLQVNFVQGNWVPKTQTGPCCLDFWGAFCGHLRHFSFQTPIWWTGSSSSLCFTAYMCWLNFGCYPFQNMECMLFTKKKKKNGMYAFGRCFLTFALKLFNSILVSVGEVVGSLCLPWVWQGAVIRTKQIYCLQAKFRSTWSIWAWNSCWSLALAGSCQLGPSLVHHEL